MSENLKRLLRKVYSCDTAAGHKLQYHITRASVCPDYAAQINFTGDSRATFSGIRSTIGNIFAWMLTSEGGSYWAGISNLIRSC